MHFDPSIHIRSFLAGLGLPQTPNEERLLSLKDKHQGQRCFILGNGPSLNDIDLTLLKDEITFGVNAIYTNFEKMGFYPTYYVVEDKFVAEDRANEINAYRDSIKLFGNYLRYCLEPDEQTILLNVIFNFKNYRNFPHFSTNMARRLWVGGTVSYLCMQIAYYMGFETVYLIGFDHSYKVPDSAIVKGSNILSTDDDVNHFNAAYFGKGKRWHDPMLFRMEKAYLKARRYFEEDGRKIVNATAGGKLEIFERCDYKSLFEADAINSSNEN
ncbi:6-hydroxymethylpterin diphosphokinase MptE-like protein [Candidatus Neomarinimicrobiota bacterium]